MDTNPSSRSSHDRDTVPSVPRSDSSLDLTRAEAKREAAKLREYRENLEARKRTEETDVRTSPLGRHDE